jgi:hypothetical protein
MRRMPVLVLVYCSLAVRCSSTSCLADRSDAKEMGLANVRGAVAKRPRANSWAIEIVSILKECVNIYNDWPAVGEWN